MEPSEAPKDVSEEKVTLQSHNGAFYNWRRETARKRLVFILAGIEVTLKHQQFVLGTVVTSGWIVGFQQGR